MAVTRLYPPNIAGTIPSFYSTTQGTSLEVPFSMNTTVSKTAVKGFRLRLKTTSTDIVIANPESTNWVSDAETLSVTFQLDDIVNKLVIGNFYKIQLAYVDSTGLVGYYSTVSIVKYTAQPTLDIINLNMQSLTSISSSQFIGRYQNTDGSEKIYQYKFDLLDTSNVVLETSDWQLHNVSNDDELTAARDIYSFKYNMIENITYRVKYSIITNNGLQLSTLPYEIVLNAIPGMDLSVVLNPVLDYENGRVKISIYPKQEEEMILSGAFIFSRCSSKDNYSVWEISQNNKLNISVSKENPYVLWDYAVEDGITYKYSFQKYTSQYVFSERVQSPTIRVWFEDAFLYDGKQQLRIRYNPTITSFKPVVSDSKKTTLGRQYPFVFRSGLLNYKEFPINGLISYFMDNDELFISKQVLKNNWKDSDATTDLTDENYYYERIFKLAVLDWLNNGDIKLFKSPQEGNYIVRLTNISLSPNTTTSRLLHSFSCTASEVAEYTAQSLSDYQLINDIDTSVKAEVTSTVNIYNMVYNYYAEDQANYKVNAAKHDITGGVPCRKIRYYCTEQQKKYSYGLTFSWGEYNFAIDRSGTYELELDDFIVAPLYLTNPDYNTATGYIELTLEAKEANPLDVITSTTSQYLYGYSIYGSREKMQKDGYSRNLLAEFNTPKTILSNITRIIYKKIPIYETLIPVSQTWDNLRADDLLSFGVDPKYILGDCCYFYKSNESDKRLQYWRYNPSTNSLEAVMNYGTKIMFGDIETDITTIGSSEYEGTLVDFWTDIPKTADGTISLKIQNGVQIQIYGRQQTISYLAEDSDLYDESWAESESYENFCAKRFNFEPALSYSKNDILYIFDKRIFVRISYEQADDYLDDGYTIYKPKWSTNKSLKDQYYSQTEIDTAWNLYLENKTALGRGLDAILA